VKTEIDMLSEKVKFYSVDSPSLAFFHCTRAEVFAAIFSSNPPKLGINYPLFMFYGKPSFFSQFSGKLNRMTVAVDGPLVTKGNFTLHDSDLSAWPSNVRDLFEKIVGAVPIMLTGEVDCVRRAAVYLFGSNRGYFNGDRILPRPDLPLVNRFKSFIEEVNKLTDAQLEKAKTIELKAEPLSLTPGRDTLFLVIPNTSQTASGVSPLKVDAALSVERDSGQAILSAADLAFDRGFCVESSVYQHPRPCEIDSLYEQLFEMIYIYYADRLGRT
jgi:hypothetical protein